MAKEVPFGSNVKLPTIEGLTSTCEEELYVLMKEIDLAFERKNQELIQEVETLKADRDAFRTENENLKLALRSKMQQFNKQEFEERNKQLLQETEKLKHENSSLKNTLQQTSRIVNERENQLEAMKNNFIIAKEKNVHLKEKLTNLQEQNISLHENYKSLLNLLSGENKRDAKSEIKQNEGISTDFMDTFIRQEKEKYLEEESEHINKLMSKINLEVEQLRDSIRTEKI